MTPARVAALRKAQLASARKRKGIGKHNVVIVTSHRDLARAMASRSEPIHGRVTAHSRLAAYQTQDATTKLQQQAKKHRKAIRRTAMVAGGAAAIGAVAFSQAHSPTSYTRTAKARGHYARQHAAMRSTLARNAGQSISRRQIRSNAKRAAAAQFPKGALHSHRNAMRVTRARMRANRVRNRRPRRR
jgi:hypothetical protein